MATTQKHRRYMQKAETPQREEQSAAPEKRRTGNWMGSLVIVGLILAIALGAYTGIFKNPFSKPAATATPVPMTMAALERNYGAQFLNYVDPSRGYSVKYPVGYTVAASTTDSEFVKFNAMTPSGIPDVARFIDLGELVTDVKVQEFVRSVPAQDQDTTYVVTGNEALTIGGRKTYHVSMTQKGSYLGEKMLVEYYMFNCPKSGVMLEAAVPESSAQERSVFTAMLESFSCG